MLIKGARVAISPTSAVKMNLWVHQGVISFSPVASADIAATLNLENFLILPGLINAHDHLELNLFPRLGHGPYPNATDWAKDIYHPQESPVRQHLGVPKSIRLRWGAIKNLVSGVTTVGHHNALHPAMFEPTFAVRVVKRYGWAHSLSFSPDWETRLRSTPANYPFIIHAAEGTNEAASRELRILAEGGALKRSTILVHGVAVRPADLPLIASKNVSLVWCPTSNHFTLGRSIDTDVLNSGIPIALGTDSAITADGDILDELRTAHRTIDAHRLYGMVTSEPARMLNLPVGFGRVCHGGPADLVIMRDSGTSPAMALLEQYPEVVIVRGRVHLASVEFAHRCPVSILRSLQPITIEGRGRYLIAEDVASLVHETKQTLQEDLRLAGKAIAA